MKQAVNRIMAFLCAFAIVAALAAIGPVAAYAAEAEAEEPTAAPNYVSVTVTEETHFSFTPNATGYWTFVTSNNTGDTPRLWVINDYGHTLASDSGTAPGNNAIVKLHLVEGAPYVIRAGYSWGGGEGTYTLTVFMSEEFVRPVRPVPVPTQVPGGGGTFSGTGSPYYVFTPEETGFWEIDIVSDGWDMDFFIRNQFHTYIAFNINWEPEFRATIRLIAGVEYTITGWIGWSDNYTMTITPVDAFEPWIDWELMSNWGINFDLEADAERIAISPGSRVAVDAETYFSFTPDEDGPWTFWLLDVATDAIILVTDTYGSFLAVNEGGRWWGDEWITVDLEAGVEYVIWAASLWDGVPDFTLYIAPFDEDMTAPDWDWDWDNDWDWDDGWNGGWGHGIRIPSQGGYTNMEDNFRFLFSPEATGSWSIMLSDVRGWSDLEVSDESGSFRVFTTDNVISMHMAAGTEYVIEVWAGWDAILQVSPTYEIHLPSGSAAAMRRVVRETDFSFIPSQTGYWVIYTSQNAGTTDPYLWLLDAAGDILAQDDDGGEGLNAMIKIHLEAGVEYTIRAGYFLGGGEYVLNVRMAGGFAPVRELVVLAPPA